MRTESNDQTNDQSTRQQCPQYMKLFDPHFDVERNTTTNDEMDSHDSITRELLQVEPPNTINGQSLPVPLEIVDGHTSTFGIEKDNPHQLRQQFRQTKFSYYVTRFSPNTTTEMILDYMRQKGVTDFESTKINCLIPRGKDRSQINFISFKIDTNEDVARTITGDGFWPKRCFIKEFVQKSIVDLTQTGLTSNPTFFHQQLQTLQQR